jgi:hypothetical protein
VAARWRIMRIVIVVVSKALKFIRWRGMIKKEAALV